MNKIDINNLYTSICHDNNYMLFNEFIILCESINYKLSQINEYKYIFEVLSKDEMKKKYFKMIFITLLKIKIFLKKISYLREKYKK